MAMSAPLTADSLKYYLTAETVVVRPTAWEISLHTADPGPAGDLNEVFDVGYGRQEVTFEVDVTDLEKPFAINDAGVIFDAAVAGYTVTHVVVWADAGTLPVVVQRLQTDKPIAVADQAEFAIGELRIGGRT